MAEEAPTAVAVGDKRSVTQEPPLKKGRNKKKNKFGKKKKSKENAPPNKRPRTDGDAKGNYALVTKENLDFESYYKALGIVPEEEWEVFMTSMRTDLPATFRIVDSRGDSVVLNNLMKEQYFSKLEGLLIEGEPCPLPENIPWYPNDHAWQIAMSRPSIRHSEELFSLHQFLVSEVERGSIARQEAVSMIPPLVLEVKPHHKVLDMCAAPGSKTLQLLEALHANGPDVEPTGLIVANDGDNKRCYMLATQTKRFDSTAFMITNEDATRFTNIKVPDSTGKIVSLKYDRILCDVPCTGDGTLRKNYLIWKKWTQNQALGIHKLQRRILLRAMDMLAEGGRIVYSTCSLNPIENEATVLSALKSRPEFQLVPSAGFLPGLKREPGMSTWKVLYQTREGSTWFEKFEDVKEGKHKKTVSPTMFPEGAEEHNIQHCMRVYPHLQNTGGFFICAIERKPVEKVEAVIEKSEADEVEEKSGENSNKTTRTDTTALVEKMNWKEYNGFREDPYYFQSPDSDCFDEVREWYKIADTFPYANVFARSKDETIKKRNLSVTSKLVRDIIIHNEKKLKVINCGVKIFTHVNEKFSKCPYRLLQEGARFAAKYMGTKLFEVAREDMIKILGPEGSPKKLLLPELQELVQDLPTGIVIFHLPGSGVFPSIYTTIYCTENYVRAYITEDEKNHLRLILGLEPLMTKREVQKKEAMDKHRLKRAETAVRIAEENERESGKVVEEVVGVSEEKCEVSAEQDPES